MQISDEEILNNEITKEWVVALIEKNKEEFPEYDEAFVDSLQDALINYKVDLKKELKNARRLSKTTTRNNPGPETETTNN